MASGQALCLHFRLAVEYEHPKRQLQDHDIHILKDLAVRSVSADESKKAMQESQLLGQQQLQWLTCLVVRGTRLEARAGASGLSEALHKSPALSAAKEQRQKDFGTRPQTVISTDQKQTSTLRNKRSGEGEVGDETPGASTTSGQQVAKPID